jgi:hypothetical protein
MMVAGRSYVVATVLLTLAGAAPPAEAGITRIVIDRVESPAFGGRVFGGVGQYEILIGRASGEVDPKDPRNAGIVYITAAPRNARGMVEYDVDLFILKPVNMDRGTQTIFYGVNNRGGKPYFPGKDGGDGFLLQQGFTLVWSGWHGDLLPGGDRLLARLPIAKQADGSPIRKRIGTEFLVNGGIGPAPIYTASGGRPILDDFYPAVEERMADAVLMRRRGPHAEPEVIPRGQWSFANCPKGRSGTPSNKHICIPAGFSEDYLYYLIYDAQHPIVQGLGFAATRDVISFLRYDTSSANPLVSAGRNSIRWTMAFGSSQSGRFLRHFLYEGFNEDEKSRIVLDGMMPHIGGGRLGFFNHEFAQTTRWSRTTEEHYQPGDEFPFTYEVLTDPVSRRTDGLLARCRKSNTCPKIMQSDDASEVWQARASLVYTDPLGKQDVAPPDNVRYYQHASVQHGPAGVPSRGICEHLSNPNRNQETLRALLIALRAWVAWGIEPPPSRYPRLADGTLTAADQVRFPNIPGVKYTGQHNHKLINDFSVLPPRHVPGTEYGVRVPQVDGDGNDIGGIRSVMLQVPVGTYTGWNLRAAGFMEGLPCLASGSFIPFAKTAAERGNDPRPSLEERYGTHQRYVDRVRTAAAQLVREGFLLQEDYFKLVANAEHEDIGLPRSTAAVR